MPESSLIITSHNKSVEAEKSIRYLKINKTDLDDNILPLEDLINVDKITFTLDNNSRAEVTILGITENPDSFLIQVSCDANNGGIIRDNNKVLDYDRFHAFQIHDDLKNGITIDSSSLGRIYFSDSHYNPPIPPDDVTINQTLPHYHLSTYNFGKTPNTTLSWRMDFTASSNNGAKDVSFVMVCNTGSNPFSSLVDFTKNPNFPLNQKYPNTWDPSNHIFGIQAIAPGSDFPTPVSINSSSSYSLSGSVGAGYMVSGSQWYPAIILDSYTGSTDITFHMLSWSLDYSTNAYPSYAENSGPYTFTSSVSTSISSSLVFEPVFSSRFQNSNWDVNMNNINDNRLNSFLMNVDYSTDLALPINLQPIRSRVEKKTSTPDSNYTTKRIIDPRYNGSKLSSYDYNAYTPPSGSTPFIFTPDESGSWGGDISYGKTAIIDKRPIYFAHFVESHPTLEAMGEMEFTIDYLIPVDIEVGENANAKSVPSIGSLPGVIKVNGDGTYQYEVSNIFEKKRKASIDFSQNISASINWGSLETNPHPIVQGGARFKGIIGNQAGNFNTIGGQNNAIYTTMSSSIFTVNQMGAGSRNFVTTMSNGLGFEGNSDNLAESFNLNNIFYKNKVPLESLNYRRWMPVSASLGSIGYSDESLIFLPKRGDEIRMLSSSEDALVFTITGMITSSNAFGASVTCSVTPDPLSFEFPATSSFFIRRKVDQDNKVLLRVPPVQGTLGNTTPSSDGFLIPNDLSKDQKTRAGHLIATLRGDNLFS